MSWAVLALLGAVAPIATQPVRQPAPVWESRAVSPSADEVPASTYIVKPGDTLSHVVEKTNASSDAIARANKLASPFALRPGQKLVIPPGRYHRVRRGEAGISIARAYGVDWSRIATINNLQEPYQLRAGDRLLLPSTNEVAKMTLEQRAAAFRIDIDDLVTGSEPALAPKAQPAPPSPSLARKLAPTVAIAAPEASFDGRFIWPLAGKVIRAFGALPNGTRNDGINVAATLGAPIQAAADGIVAYAGTLAAFGQLILIRHGDGWLTAYGHAQTLLVTRGQAVSRGQTIARAGATGSASEPQLHFEIRQGRRAVNPVGLLPATKG